MGAGIVAHRKSPSLPGKEGLSTKDGPGQMTGTLRAPSWGTGKRTLPERDGPSRCNESLPEIVRRETVVLAAEDAVGVDGAVLLAEVVAVFGREQDQVAQQALPAAT